MTSENKTWVAGLVGVAVGATLAVLIVLVSQPSASRDQATGAIGAAERYRSEQIKPGDTGISGAAGPSSPTGTAAVAEMLGRAAADRQAWALERAALELKDSWWNSASPAERMDHFLRVSPETQRMIVDRVDNKSERAALERVMADRAAQDRVAAEALGKMSAEVWNKAALELKDSWWNSASPAERMSHFLRVSPETQRMIADRVDNKAERMALERVMADRAAQDRVAAEALGKVSAEVWNKAALELKDSWWNNASPAERMHAFLRAAPETQRMVVDRIDNKAERAVFDRLAAQRIAHDRIAAEVGKVSAEVGRISAATWGSAALELKSAWLGNASPAERMNQFLRASSETQRMVVDRVDSKAERAAFDRVMADRMAQDRAAAELAKFSAESWNKAALELKDAWWGNASPAERVNEFLRANSETQRMVVDRMDSNQRAAFDRMMVDRAAQDRMSNQRAAQD
ncbi:MAG: hypothetical protein HY825_10715 [Acidobacteria bacterium]|nr:hypothetical protein [Acidobacteriota bacterium]